MDPTLQGHLVFVPLSSSIIIKAQQHCFKPGPKTDSFFSSFFFAGGCKQKVKHSALWRSGVFFSQSSNTSEPGPLESCKKKERCTTRWDTGALKHHQCSFSQLFQPGVTPQSSRCSQLLGLLTGCRSCFLSRQMPFAFHPNGVHCNLTGPYGIFNVKMAFCDIFF